MTKNTKKIAMYIRNFMFGVEDSLVSTVGLLSGVAAAGMDKKDIFITGVILIFVEAVSMGAGSFLSEDFAEDLVEKTPSLQRQSMIAATIMFFSYILSGLIPLLPYLYFDVSQAMIVSVGLTLASLFCLGAFSAIFFKKTFWAHGFKVLLIGSMAIAIGFVVGSLHDKILQ